MGIQEPLQTTAGGECVGKPLDHRDPAMSVPDQVLGGFESAAVIINDHRA